MPVTTVTTQVGDDSQKQIRACGSGKIIHSSCCPLPFPPSLFLIQIGTVVACVTTQCENVESAAQPKLKGDNLYLSKKIIPLCHLMVE